MQKLAVRRHHFAVHPCFAVLKSNNQNNSGSLPHKCCVMLSASKCHPHHPSYSSASSASLADSSMTLGQAWAEWNYQWILVVTICWNVSLPNFQWTSFFHQQSAKLSIPCSYTCFEHIFPAKTHVGFSNTTLLQMNIEDTPSQTMRVYSMILWRMDKPDNPHVQDQHSACCYAH